jgi:16S rRNA (guanine527-N7)-methyltransferase
MFHVEQAWREAFVDGAKTLHIPLTIRQIDQFHLYLRELLAWNQKVNLTSITDEREVAVKHFLDSLAVYQALGAGSLLDVGSGAGFPGLPLKIFDPARHVTLLEPNHKKTAFLRHLVGTLRLSSISVLPRRLEDLGQDAKNVATYADDEQVGNDTQFSSRFANIVTRALAVIPALEHIRPLLANGGRLIWCRAHHLDVTVEDKGFAVIREIEYALPRNFGNRVLTVLRPT